MNQFILLGFLVFVVSCSASNDSAKRGCHNIYNNLEGSLYKQEYMNYLSVCFGGGDYEEVQLVRVLDVIRDGLLSGNEEVIVDFAFNASALLIDTENRKINQFSSELVGILDEKGKASERLHLLRSLYLIFKEGLTGEGVSYLDDNVSKDNPFRIYIDELYGVKCLGVSSGEAINSVDEKHYVRSFFESRGWSLECN